MWKLLVCCLVSNLVGVINVICLLWVIVCNVVRVVISVLLEFILFCIRCIIGIFSVILCLIFVIMCVCVFVGLNGKVVRSLFFSVLLVFSGWVWKCCVLVCKVNMLRLCVSSFFRIRWCCVGCCLVFRLLSCSVGGGWCKVCNVFGSVIIFCDSFGGRSFLMV